MTNIMNAFLLSGSAALAIEIKPILIAGAVVGISGLCIGILLGIAAVLLKMKINQKELMVREVLPGANCGGCGYAGCDALAKAIADGEAPVNACPVASAEVTAEIGKIVGKEAGNQVKKVAFVKCAGTCDKTATQYEYHGSMDCKRASVVPGKGDKACGYGCMGYGTCEKTCKFDAIHIIDGCAVVDREKCTACGQCITACPNNIIELVPYDSKHLVRCSSKAKGKEVRKVCSVGCIGCMICAKQCEYDAITIADNLAYIDPEKCTNCGKCAEKCPQKTIL